MKKIYRDRSVSELRSWCSMRERRHSISDKFCRGLHFMLLAGPHLVLHHVMVVHHGIGRGHLVAVLIGGRAVQTDCFLWKTKINLWPSTVAMQIFSSEGNVIEKNKVLTLDAETLWPPPRSIFGHQRSEKTTPEYFRLDLNVLIKPIKFPWKEEGQINNRGAISA